MMQNLLLEFNSLTLEQRAEHWNKVFPKIPKTVYDKGWIYGTWYCGTSFKKSTYYGQHPYGYLKKVKALFPDCKDAIHLCSGTVREDITVDLRHDTKGGLVRPSIASDVQCLPFRPNSADLITIDPPYSKRDANVYYAVALISVQKAMKEALRVLRVGGFFCVLDVRYPSYHRSHGWKLVGLIGICTGFGKTARWLSIFQKVK